MASKKGILKVSVLQANAKGDQSERQVEITQIATDFVFVYSGEPFVSK